MGSLDLMMSVFDIHLRRLLWMYYLIHAWVKRRKLVGKACTHYKWLTSRKILNVEELETVPPVTEPKDITQSIAWRRDRPRKRKRSTIFLERTYKRGPSSTRWTLEPFLRHVGETSERRGGMYMFFSRVHRHHLELNWTELNSTETRTQTVGPATNLAALLDVGEHDDLCDALLPDHPPEVADAVGTRT